MEEQPGWLLEEETKRVKREGGVRSRGNWIEAALVCFGAHRGFCCIDTCLFRAAKTEKGGPW